MYLKKAVRGTVFVAIMIALTAVFSYLFRIVIAKKLSVAEYGLFFLIFSFFSFFSVFTEIGLSKSVSRKIVELKVDSRYAEIKSVLMSILAFQIICSFIILLLMLFFQPQLKSFLHTDSLIPFYLMGLWFLTLPITAFFANAFLGFQKSAASSSLELFRHAFSLIATVIFFYMGYGALSPFIAYGILNFFAALLYLPLLNLAFSDFFKLKYYFNKKLLVEIFQFGIVLSFSSLLFNLVTSLDSFMLSYFWNLEEVGIYNAALPVAFFLSSMSGILGFVAYPLITELNARKMKKQLQEGLNLLYRFLLIFTLPAMILMITFSDIIIKLMFGDKFLAAVPTLSILCVAVFFAIFNSTNQTVLIATGHQKRTLVLAVVMLIVNAILNIFLIPKWASFGAAIAALATFIAVFMVSTYEVKKQAGVIAPFWLVIGGLASSLVGIAFAYYLRTLLPISGVNLNSMQSIILISVASLVVFFILVTLMRIMKLSDAKQFMKLSFEK